MKQERFGKAYWCVSVSRDEEDFEGKSVMRDMEKLSNSKLGLIDSVNIFEFPNNFKIGTYDTIMTLSDELKKVDNYIEIQIKKIASWYWKADGKKNDDGFIHFSNDTPDHYLKNFKWDSTRYSTRKQLNEIVDGIQSEVSKIEEELRIKVQAFTSIESVIQKTIKDESGTLLTKDLTNILKNVTVEESEYTTTLFVVVPRTEEKNWKSCYEFLTEWVLPKSSVEINDDNDYKLFSVITFKNFVDEFKNEARKRKFTVRKHETNINFDESKKEELKNNLNKRKKDLNRFCKTNYGEIFMAWVHIKAIRIFVESVLRFGLPPRYTSVVIEPHPKNERKLLKALTDQYKNLFNSDMGEITDVDKTTAGLFIEEFYPFVFVELFIDSNEK
jgi:V-type H+-transporting ATPase subunit C